MAAKRLRTSANVLYDGLRSSALPAQRRSMATMAPETIIAQSYTNAHLTSTTPPTRTPPFQPQRNPFLTTATLTTHAFPTIEPTGTSTYPSTHLLLPLRKDLLHRAVIYEGDMTRQGTASTKYRSEVHGSNRKIRPQKGTGSARLGDKKSPMLKGGGVAFGPHPRNFATDLPRKVYDCAWRTALSYRYRRGELLLLDGEAELQNVTPNSAERYMRDLLRHNRWGRDAGRTLFVTTQRREALFAALEGERMGAEARALEVGEVDVKDLLELGRVVLERAALEKILRTHEEDLAPGERLGAWRLGLKKDDRMTRRDEKGGAVAAAVTMKVALARCPPGQGPVDAARQVRNAETRNEDGPPATPFMTTVSR
ncbi:54S ribosomal protein yml6, mitochondrial [Teratosphaeriaceae sp. CCFEE 6253]|nr:54S ribosomal protein yml6, mitochondrial [Teratosphaeriaceae sp. CCFEE 6253]